MPKIIAEPRSVVVHFQNAGADVVDDVVRKTSDMKGIGGYILSQITLIGSENPPKLIRGLKEYTSKPLIFDPQASIFDYEDTDGEYERDFGRVVKQTLGFDAVIILIDMFTSAPEILNIMREEGLEPIVKAELTMPGFLEFLSEKDRENLMRLACEKGVKAGMDNFWVPGNDAERIRWYKAIIEPAITEPDYFLYSPFTRYTDFGEIAGAAGARFHALAEHNIWGAPDVRKAAQDLVSRL